MSASGGTVVPAHPVAARDDARERIFDGAVRCLVRDGASASMAGIAAAAGVSKALLHYHHGDRSRLLASVAGRLGQRIRRRERTAIERAAAGSAMDALWDWVQDELQRGEMRALLELGALRDDAVRAVTAMAARARRDEAARTAERLFAQLGLTPRMPAALLGDASVAFVDGLALDAGNGRDPRVSFDLFWLALLGLAE